MAIKEIQSSFSENVQESSQTKLKQNKNRFDELFNENWEVFVVKLDEETGTFVGKVACCALEPV